MPRIIDHAPVDYPWYELALVQDLPTPHRLYAWWAKNGLKRKDGSTWGGNKLFRLMRSSYAVLPHNRNNYISIPAYEGKFVMTVDLTDFEVPQHTLPLSVGRDSEAKLLELLFPIGGTFFDVGANYGFYSLLAAYLGGEDANVYAFEPQPRLVEALSQSKQKNQFMNLRVNEMALGDRQGEVEFFIPDTGSGVGSIFREHAAKFSSVKKQNARMETLDAVFENENLQQLDIIKIDVEGAESDVLKGAANTIGKHQPYVWFEMNPTAQKTAGRDQEAIYSLLEKSGYREFYDIDDVARGMVKPIRIVDGLTNVLAVPEMKRDVLTSIIKGRC